MFILLLALFIVALIIICAGLLLSPKMPTTDQRGVSYAGRAMRSGEIRRASGARQMRVRRSTLELERRSLASTAASTITSLTEGSLFGRRTGKPTPWVGIALILIALFGVGLISLRTVLLDPDLLIAGTWGFDSPASTSSTNAAPDPFAGLAGASKALVRLSQLDPQQYSSPQEYAKWAYSACSAAAMTEVINAYGHNYHITDILTYESQIGEITPTLGLLEPTGIDRTVAHFGFKTVWLNKSSLEHVIDVANQGRPVIVSFPPDRWDGGHLLVVRGGNSGQVYLADSSMLDLKILTHEKFMKYWAGFAVVVVPK